MTPGVEVLTTVPLQRLRQRAPSAQYPRRAQCVIAIGYRNPRFAWIVGVTAQRLHRQRRLEPALTGVSGGTLGYPRGLGRPSAGRYEPDSDAERHGDGQLATNHVPGGAEPQHRHRDGLMRPLLSEQPRTSLAALRLAEQIHAVHNSTPEERSSWRAGPGGWLRTDHAEYVGAGAAGDTEPAAPGTGVDGCFRGYPGVPPWTWKALSGPL